MNYKSLAKLLCLTSFISISEAMDVAPLFSERVNFKDESVCQKLFSPECMPVVKNLIEEKYEANSRPISNTTGFDYGNSFSTYPEILTYLMSDLEGKTVLEMGASDGTESLFLACSQAKPLHLFVNDLDQAEIHKFEQRKAALPLELQSKLTSICGDALEIPTLKPELKGTIDKLYVRFCAPT